MGKQRFPIPKQPILSTLNQHLIDHPTPSNLSYWWGFGSLAGIRLAIQIVTGVSPAMHHTPHVDLAFNSVEHIMRDVEGGWLLRYMHVNGASMFSIVVYLHIFRGSYHASHGSHKEFVRDIGVVLFLLGRKWDKSTKCLLLRWSGHLVLFSLFFTLLDTSVDVALCQPSSSEDSLGALIRTPEAPLIDDLLGQPDQGTGGVGSATVEGGAAAALASTPPIMEGPPNEIWWPLHDGTYLGYLSWAHLFPEHVQPWGTGAPWLSEYRIPEQVSMTRDIQETLGCVCCPKASCPLWKPGGWGAHHHHPLPGDLSPAQFAYFWHNFPQPKYYILDR